jgi:hypothetical protein
MANVIHLLGPVMDGEQEIFRERSVGDGLKERTELYVDAKHPFTVVFHINTGVLYLFFHYQAWNCHGFPQNSFK